MDKTAGLSTLVKKNTSTPSRTSSIPQPSGYSNYCPILSRLLQLGQYSLSHQRTVISIWSRMDKFKFKQDNNNPDSSI